MAIDKRIYDIEITTIKIVVAKIKDKFVVYQDSKFELFGSKEFDYEIHAYRYAIETKDSFESLGYNVCTIWYTKEGIPKHLENYWIIK